LHFWVPTGVKSVLFLIPFFTPNTQNRLILRQEKVSRNTKFWYYLVSDIMLLNHALPVSHGREYVSEK
jgi:hypothetical protein